ncbi:unnamed protein product, partial [Prorocentrum cordatum]
MDPRLTMGDLRTEAPTVTGNSTLLFFTPCQRFTLAIYAASAQAALMQGDEQPDQQLFMAQPREGLPGFDPKQLIQILKGEWLTPHFPFKMLQNPLDPALYYGFDPLDELCVVVAHVDDLLLGVSTKYQVLYNRPEEMKMACYTCGRPQTEYANTIEDISLSQERKRALTAEATPAEFSYNRSALGALGSTWLSSQTRPDLAAGVAMGQRTQNTPTVQ